MSKTTVTIESSADPSTVTLVQKAIHNPKEPRHYMTVNPTEGNFTVKVGDTTIASASKALEMTEVAHILIRPILYFNKSDVQSEYLVPSTKESKCPLKGIARYYNVSINGTMIENAAWSYHQTITGAQVIKDHYSFDPSLIKVDIRIKGLL